MPSQYDLTNEYVSNTYERLLQIVDNNVYNGLGNPISLTSSYSTSSSYALSASWAPGGSSESSSYATTSSHALISNTASYYGGNVVSSSYSTTSSHSLIANTASYYGGSVVSSSYATTSSFSNKSSLSDSATTSSHSLIANTASYYGGSVISSSYSTTSSHSLIANTASYYGGSVISSSYSSFTPYIQTIGMRISTEDTYITAGSKGYKHIGFPCNIIKTRTISTETGSINVNIKRNGNLLGNINITNSTGSYDSSVIGWETQLITDDLIEFYISGSSTYITDITIFIDIQSRQI